VIKVTAEQFLKRAKEIFGELYDYSKAKYVNSTTEVKIICSIHGPFWKTPNKHISSKQGCPECGMSRRTAKRTSDIEAFIKKANEVHNNKYNYSNAVYVNSHTKLEIICPIHGAFPQIPSSHLSGAGCYMCAVEERAKSIASNTNEFIKRVKEIHGEKYDYSKVNYISAIIEIEIICPIHGSFPQTPHSHLQGRGCSECGVDKRAKSKTSTTEIFIGRANIKHDFKYDYHLVDYVSAITEIEIICPIHGPFPQAPVHHLQGHGCPKCAHTISKPETAWLNSLNIPNNKKHRNVYIKIKSKKRGFKVDGFDPATNTIYEFYGDFWHGNPNNSRFKPTDYNKITHCTFNELYIKTLEKEQALKAAGYKVISIWESDFVKPIKNKKKK
jgi:G:T-mismatch repair DNA endonuclease (very short patch repair protein)